MPSHGSPPPRNHIPPALEGERVVTGPDVDLKHMVAHSAHHPALWGPSGPVTGISPSGLGFLAGDMSLGNGMTGMSLDFEHQLQQQLRLSAAVASASPAYTSYGSEGFDSPYRSSSVIAGAGSGWAWGATPPQGGHGMVEIEGRGWEGQQAAGGLTPPLPIYNKEHSQLPTTLGSGGSGAMAYGSPVPGATTAASGSPEFSRSQDGGRRRGRSRLNTSEGEMQMGAMYCRRCGRSMFLTH